MRETKTNNERMKKMGEFLTVKEAAKLLHMTTITILKLCRNGTIKAKKIPGSNKWLINSDELKKILP